LKRYIVTPDKHFPYEDKKAISVVCKAIEAVKPDGYIDLGDTGEWASVSHWQWKRKTRPPLEYYLPNIIQEIDLVNKGIDKIDESLDKANVQEKHFITGNHDQWLNYFVDEFPYLDQYSLNTAIKLDERGYKVEPLGKLLTIGDMKYYHGHNYAGMNHASNHCRQYKKSIMYGHHHDLQVYTDKSSDGPITAYSIGCLKDLSPEVNGFVGGRPMNWKHAFAIVTYHGSNSFVDIIEIKNGKAIVDGILIEG
tara:strand:+ start:2166 stop:2918 length:753 start_codon:yes stop_codon:yes gene_type:complete